MFSKRQLRSVRPTPQDSSGPVLQFSFVIPRVILIHCSSVAFLKHHMERILQAAQSKGAASHAKGPPRSVLRVLEDAAGPGGQLRCLDSKVEFLNQTPRKSLRRLSMALATE